MASSLDHRSTADLGEGREEDSIVESRSSHSDMDREGSDSGSDACPWRTRAFHDQECARYFDCPTHIVERRLSVDEIASPPDETTESQNSGALFERTLEGNPQTAAGSPSNLGVARGTSADVRSSESATTPTEAPGASPEIAIPLPASVSGSSAASSHSVARDETTSVADDRPEVHEENEPDTEEDLYEPSPEVGLTSAREEQDETPEASPTQIRSDVIGLPSPRRDSRPSLSLHGREGSLGYLDQRSVPSRTTQSAWAAQPPLPDDQRGPLDFALPRWQPDAEVTYCPICHSQFNFFVRKHHCRKCGRVVCNSCSPHRIIIPYQFIVRPPGSEYSMSTNPYMEGLIGRYMDIDGPAGGERVRLCNPCVPDPQTAPPQSPGLSRSTSRGLQRVNRSSLGDAYGTAAQTNRHGMILSDNRQNYRGLRDPYGAAQASRSAVFADNRHHYPHGTYSQHSSRSRSITMGQPSQAGSSAAARRSSALYSSPLDRLLAASNIMASSSSYPNRYGLVGDAPSSSRQPPPVVAEEDECPICHRELPSRDLPDFESLRETHVAECIQAHSTYGSPRRGSGTASSPAAPRRTGMYSYPATEKDCIDDAECTICLEEFTVGVQMARLECLCRFHRSCIAAWFVNHPGRCPVHQHDGFGY